MYAFSRKLFLQKAPCQMFDWVFNAALIVVLKSFSEGTNADDTLLEKLTAQVIKNIQVGTCFHHIHSV